LTGTQGKEKASKNKCPQALGKGHRGDLGVNPCLYLTRWVKNVQPETWEASKSSIRAGGFIKRIHDLRVRRATTYTLTPGKKRISRAQERGRTLGGCGRVENRRGVKAQNALESRDDGAGTLGEGVRALFAPTEKALAVRGESAACIRFEGAETWGQKVSTASFSARSFRTQPLSGRTSKSKKSGGWGGKKRKNSHSRRGKVKQ